MSDPHPPRGPTPPEDPQPPEAQQPAPTTSPYESAPPSRLAAGVVVGLIVALVLLAGVLVFGVYVIANDDDDPPAARETSTSETPDDASDDAQPAAPDETDDPGSAVAAISGEGYSYPLPEGWQEATDEVLAQSPTSSIDTVSVLGDSFATARANVLVEVGPTGGETDVTVLRPSWEGNITTGGADPIPIDDTEIAGERAVGIRTERVNDAGTEVEQIAYLVIHEDAQFSIALSYPAGDAAFPDPLDEILASWTWE